jgi:hypothetical protein
VNVLAAVKQNAVGWAAVAPCAPGLLVVALHVFWHIVMRNERYVGFVYSHAESICRNHYLRAVVQKILLVVAPL